MREILPASELDFRLASSMNRPPDVSPNSPSRVAVVLDLDTALRRLGNDRELYCEFVGFFEEDAPKLLSQLESAISKTDSESAERSAHSLKGLSSNLGADAVTEVAGRAEKLVRSGNISECQNLLPELRQELETLLLALRPYRKPEKLQN